MSVWPAPGSAYLTAKLFAQSSVADLAVIRVDGDKIAEPISFLRTGVALGEDVAVFGYPLTGLLSRDGNFTKGNVTALGGLGDDPRNIQLSAPVQPGNSGGPVLDIYGSVVGIVVSKFRANNGEAPADLINFAVKSDFAVDLLAKSGLALECACSTAKGLFFRRARTIRDEAIRAHSL